MPDWWGRLEARQRAAGICPGLGCRRCPPRARPQLNYRTGIEANRTDSGHACTSLDGDPLAPIGCPVALAPPRATELAHPLSATSVRMFSGRQVQAQRRHNVQCPFGMRLPVPGGECYNPKLRVL